MNYVLTYSYYIDCPTCQGSSSYDAESCYAKTFTSKKELLAYILKDFQILEFLRLYEIRADGRLKPVCINFITKYGFHSIAGVKFTIGNEGYVIAKDKNGTHRYLTPAEILLYEPK